MAEMLPSEILVEALSDPSTALMVSAAVSILVSTLLMLWCSGTFSGNEPEKPTKKQPNLPTPDDVYRLVRKRRSIFPKDFNGGTVPDDVIEEMLEAANWAPTHGKTEPWRFVVLRSAESKKEVAAIKRSHLEAEAQGDAGQLEKLRAKLDGKEKELEKVAAMIVIVVKRVTNHKGNLMPEWEEIAAVSCAVQNMHLALTSHWAAGYGGYWSSGGWDTWLQCDKMRAYCDADGSVNREQDKILGIFYVGQSDVAKMSQYRARRGDIDDKTTWK